MSVGGRTAAAHPAGRGVILRCPRSDTPESLRRLGDVLDDWGRTHRLSGWAPWLAAVAAAPDVTERSVDRSAGGRGGDERIPALLTFDAGTFTPGARSLLIARGLRAVVALRTGGIEGTHRDHGTPAEPAVSSWGDVRRLVAAGFDVASGGHTLADDAVVSDVLALDELQLSRALLEDALGSPVNRLVLPPTWSPERARASAAASGFEAAFTLRPGTVGPDTDPLTLPRVLATDDEWRAGTPARSMPSTPEATTSPPRAGLHALASAATPGTSSFRRTMAEIDLDDLTVRRPAPSTDPAPLTTRVVVRRGGHPLGEVTVTGLPGAATDAVDDLIVTAAVGRFGGVPAGDAPLAPPADPPLVSVVVTTMDNEAACAATVSSILAGPWGNLDLIVVDNRPFGSRLRDHFDQVGLSDDPRVRIVDEYRRGLSSARNAGLRAARGDYTLITDDDVIIDQNWITALMTPFLTDPEVSCVTGAILPLELETPAQQWLEEYGGYYKGYERQVYDMGAHRRDDPLYPFDAGRFGSGANLAFRTSALRSLGGFAEDLGAGTPARGGEDLDIFRRTVFAGHRLIYQPAALLWHAHRRSAATLHGHLLGYGVGLSATLTRWWCESGEVRVAILRRGAAGLRHLLSADSGKNEKKTGSFPAELSRQELRGVALGPLRWRDSHRIYG